MGSYALNVDRSRVQPRTENGKKQNQILQSIVQNMCSERELKKRLPILEWLPKYTWTTLLQDFIAGMTVGLTAIPQGIAYAVVAGLEPQYGLYSAFMGCFVYCFLGSCKDITIGPTAIMALMTQKYVESHGPSFAILLCFLTGCYITLLGVLRLGFLVEFISMPVTAGFTSAAAITIGSSQLKGLFGLSGSSHGFLDSWISFFSHISEYRLWDSVLGISTVVVLVILKKMKKWSQSMRCETTSQKILKHTAGLFGLGRNAVVVVLGTLLAYLLATQNSFPFVLTGKVGAGLPQFSAPPFSVQEGNSTLSFIDMVTELGSANAVVPLIAVLESIAIAKAFSKGKTVDATQELIALGISNIAGSFLQSFPTTGSFTRTAVNHASGVVTPAGGIFTGALVIMSLGFLTSTFYYIPKATLAAVIISAMFNMVEYKIVELLWRSKRTDLIPLCFTLVSCLFWGLEYGMVVGISVNLLFILYNSARPRVSLQWIGETSTEALLVTPTQSLVFPATDYIREVIIQNCINKSSYAPVILEGTYVHHIDSTIAKGIKVLIDDLESRGQKVVLWRWLQAPMQTLLGLDPKLEVYFNSSPLEEIINGASGHGEHGKYEAISSEDNDPCVVTS